MDDPKLNLPGPQQPGPEHHGARGRFVAGNPGNKKAPGRPKGRPNFWTELKRAVKNYRTTEGRKYFDALLDRSLQVRSGVLGKTVLDKLFEDATLPKGIDLTMVQGSGGLEEVVKDLARARAERAAEAGRVPFGDDAEDEP